VRFGSEREGGEIITMDLIRQYRAARGRGKSENQGKPLVAAAKEGGICPRRNPFIGRVDGGCPCRYQFTAQGKDQVD